jgi:hypothetical protein
LKWAPGGNFSATCENIQLSDNGFLLLCAAAQGDGSKILATLDLAAGIQSKDSELEIDI